MKSKKNQDNHKPELKLENSEKETLKENVLSVNDEIKKLQEQNLELSREILASTRYIKKYVRHKRIFIAVKWSLVILIVIFGFLSFDFVLDYLQELIGSYQNQVNQIVEQTNNAIK
ncbi:hypothetical protein GW758_03085 [Candidatus Falkowbacteria bacterium]|nr:hypothetical protein [Candidatus Falkowbacteria bacterium]NCT54913.1 hypothetical protein [Candidatus Falkowbacteria bacterium]